MRPGRELCCLIGQGENKPLSNHVEHAEHLKASEGTKPDPVWVLICSSRCRVLYHCDYLPCWVQRCMREYSIDLALLQIRNLLISHDWRPQTSESKLEENNTIFRKKCRKGSCWFGRYGLCWTRSFGTVTRITISVILMQYSLGGNIQLYKKWQCLLIIFVFSYIKMQKCILIWISQVKC